MDTQPTLGGINYNIVYRYNERDPDNTYRIMDIYINDKPVVVGVALRPSVPLLRWRALPEFSHGDLVLSRMLVDYSPPTLDNVGQGKSYELLYFSNEEIEFLFKEGSDP